MRLRSAGRTEATRWGKRKRPEAPRPPQRHEPERPQRVWSLLLSPRDFSERR